MSNPFNVSDDYSKIEELKKIEEHQRDSRTDENISRGEFEGFVSVAFEKIDILFKSMQVLMRTLVKTGVISENDLVKEEEALRSELIELNKKADACPNNFYGKTEVEVCNQCKVECPYD